MNVKNYKKELVIAGVTLAAGVILGWLIFHSSPAEVQQTSIQTEKEIHSHDVAEGETIWTCSMHPQIRMDEPGQCPICGMDLIPLENAPENEASDPSELTMTESAMKLADIQTVRVKSDIPVRTTYLLGKVTADERRIAELTARFGGRIEKLYINFTGQYVKKGEKLASIYSPGLVSAQQELLEALKYKETNPAFYKSARTKLKLWDLTEKQIDALENGKEVQHYFSVLSPVTGTVTMRHVTLGDYVKEGEPLFKVIDLSRVWIMFEAYENDLPWIHNGDEVKFTIQSLPGKTFSGKITFIDPVISPKTRIARARVELGNPRQLLKPGMFANGIIEGRIGTKKSLLIPKSSVLWTGKRAVVYVKVPNREQPSFLHREIILGPDAGELYVVNSGLTEGEEIAMNGVFKIDAASQLAGKPSMMNPSGGKVSTGHNHAGMDMGGSGESSSGSVEMETGAKTGNMESMATPIAFKKQLNAVVNHYIKLKDAFVASDEKTAEAAARATIKALEKVNMGLLKGNAHNRWMSLLKPLTENLNGIVAMKGIEMKRTHFITVSEKLAEAVKVFGTDTDRNLYLEFCPMADNNSGAYWISLDTAIRNPYFGEQMLTCGEVKDTLNR